MRVIIKRIVALIIYIIIAAILILAFLLITEFSPKGAETLKIVGKSTTQLKKNSDVTILSYNIGHLISSKDETYFLEGGKGVKPNSKDVITQNLDKIKKTIEEKSSDIVLLQDVDYKANISYNVNEYVELSNEFEGISSYAIEQNVFVPYPLKNMVGYIKTGICTLSKFEGTSYRLALQQQYSFPKRLFEAKKCLQKLVIPIEKSDLSLVVINVDLEDYGNPSVRNTQLETLKSEMLLEYNKGNYVIAGGDFNMLFPDDQIKEYSTENYTTSKMEIGTFPKDWKFVTDVKKDTFRLRDKAYTGTENATFTATVDGFIVTPNVEVKKIDVIDLNFESSNHNPVKLEVKLK